MADPEGGAAGAPPCSGWKNDIFGPKYAPERFIWGLRFQNFPGKQVPYPSRAYEAGCGVYKFLQKSTAHRLSIALSQECNPFSAGTHVGRQKSAPALIGFKYRLWSE